MNAIVVDLEFNQPSNKVIQIGAVCINIRSGKIISEFKCFIDPHETLDPFIIELTGFSQELIDLGYEYRDALELFWNWIKDHNSRFIVAWGNDHRILMQDSKDLDMNYPSKLRGLDLKSMFMVLRCGIPNRKVKGGLKNTLETVGLEFEGRQHNALVDAKNTAKLLIYAKDLQYMLYEFKKMLDNANKLS